MPLSKYFGGHGAEVMEQMKKKHGKRAEEVFYRTVNKRKSIAGGSKKGRRMKKNEGY